MVPDVSAFTTTCTVCAQNKTPTQAPSGLLQPLPVPHRPWSHISLDFITGLPSSDGNTVILKVVDRFSKAAHFLPLAKLPSAKETAQLMVQHVFRIHGLPVDMVSDRVPQFSSQLWKAFCNLIGLSASLSSRFHPQINGQSERANQDLETTLRCLVSTNPTTWSRQLFWVEYAQDSLPSSATGLTQWSTQKGNQPPLFPEQEQEVSVPSAQMFVHRCQCTWRRAMAAILKTNSRYRRQADHRQTPAPRYRIGQRVWLSTRDLPLRVECHKQSPCFIGPFPISRVLSSTAVRLVLPRTLCIHPTFHMSKIKPVSHCSLSSVPRPTPLPVSLMAIRPTQ
uniref:Integrase catalytic domain-containing protein n=1 Tax=Oncorhynchus mykiss TaxID=8022 RepID=A0A8C7VPF1_ONCMY